MADVSQRIGLPIDRYLQGLLEQVSATGAAVVVAEPGAGKTTRVPAALLTDGRARTGEIWVLQPRRIACRMSASRVADELGERVGERIGYQVRFEEKSSPRTRVRFVTEGILARRLVSDPRLDGIAVVVMDEFHERSLHADFVLACLARLRNSVRPDLALLVMSATLDAEPVAKFLGCSVTRVPGRTFPVVLSYAHEPGQVPLEKQVGRAVRGLVESGDTGDILVFLPGIVEIRRSLKVCQTLCSGGSRDVLMLHGDLPPAEQDKAVAVSTRPKVILATNIAETSLTLPSVTAVVDSGLARLAGHSPFSGLPTLSVRPISQASAIQRAGRAGRVAAGKCVRLYSEHDFQARPRHDPPELLRADLSEMCLALASLPFELGVTEWLLAPPKQALRSAERLLFDLQAVEEPLAGAGVKLTKLGEKMQRWPLHPRLARVLAECEQRGIGRAGATVAALLGDRDLSLATRYRSEGGGVQGASDDCTGPSDVLARLELFERVEGSRFDRHVARAEQADLGVARRVAQVQKRLVRLLAEPGTELCSDDDEEALGMALLSGFPDRVAKRRANGSPEVVFCRGGSARLADASVVREAEFMVVVDAAEVTGRKRFVQARLAGSVQPEWLLEMFPDSVVDTTEVRFDSATGRADAHHVLRYEGLVLDESRAEASPDDLSAALLMAAQERGLEKVFDVEPLNGFLARLSYAQNAGVVDSALELSVRAVAEMACAGAQTLDDLRRRSLLEYLPALVPGDLLASLERAAPTHVTLPSGCRLPVHYEADRPPWVQSRLQDFFGMAQGPTVCGRSLVLHLLAPNRRAVQVTQDLAGFWQRHYPELRKPLMRRYPRHPFPDDPLNAEPPPPRVPRAGRPRRK